jgi:hypothetical protein
MKTVGYVRVSTDKQADQGISLDAQADKIRAMAVVQGAELLEMIVDGGESAKSLKRPGMAKLLALVDAGKVQTVIIAKLDRLTRSVKDLCELLERFERRGVTLVSVAEFSRRPPGAQHHGRGIPVGAGGDRRTDARCSEAQKASGERVGNVAYGYRLAADGQHLEADTQEQTALAEIRRLRESGTTLRGIARELNLQAFRTREGQHGGWRAWREW